MPYRNRRERANTGENQRAGVWRHARRLLILSVVAVIVSGSLLIRAEAAAGDLDTTFSGDGRQITSFSTAMDTPRAMALQSDGKIVVAGWAYNSVSMDYDIALARYNTDGTPDTTFSRDGKQTTDFSGMYNFAVAVAIQTDGKIVVAGYVRISDVNSDFAVARYNTNGTLDTSFSTDGKLTTDFNGKNDTAHAIAIQSDGKIVVAGQAISNGTGHDFAVARYNTNGTLDTTFSTDGKQTTDLGTLYDAANAMIIQPNGKIVAAGSVGQLGGSSNFALARYNTDGNLDTTFSTDGKQTTDFYGQDDAASAVAIQPNGKLVAVGYTYLSLTTSNFALARYNGNGTLDTTFSGDGRQDTDFFGPNSQANAVAIQSDSKIVVAGSASHASNTNFDFALARYNGNGSLDTTFSGDGKQNTYFSLNKDEGANAVAIQTNGRIVAVGSIEKSSTNYDFGLARYLGN